MAYEDKTLSCVQCNKEFTFTAGEQEFFAEKGFTSEPKRCKDCRVARRKRSRAKSDGIYRSPAFEGSAPDHQKLRGGRGPRSREYRAPSAGGDRRRGGGVYRSPAFREHEHLKPEDEYRSPGFQEQAKLNPEEEYRSPGFREQAEIDPKEEYRSPGFQDAVTSYKDEKPMFAIVCDSCGAEAMVPFLPEEREESLCQECFAARRKESSAQEAAPEEAPAPPTEEPPEESPEE